MIDIYAIYTRHSSGTIKLQSIPAGSQDQIYLLNPTVKVEMGNAESMDFSVQAGTPYYDAFIQMRTFIRVDYDGTTIFYGRVLTIDNGAFGSRKIHCEGAISLLNDTQFPGKPEKERDEISIYEHMQEIIRNHNSQVGDGLKQFSLGEVPGHYSGASSEQQIANESREFGSTSWADSKSLLEDLKSHYGGHFRARYDDGTIYLDWMNHYFRSTVNSQTIEVGKNLIDISGTTEVNNIFTAIIPIGKKENTKDGEDDKVYISYNGRNYLLIPEVCDFYSDGELNSGYHSASDYRNAISNYGMIFKTVDIQEGRTSDELLHLAAKWIKENYQGGVESFSVKAIDLRQIGENTDKILCGDRVRISYMTGSTDLAGHKATTVLTCTAVTYDLFNPENNQYSFGIPANSLGKNYGVKNTSGSTKKSTESSVPKTNYSGGGNEPQDNQAKWEKAVFAELKKHKTWFKSTGRKETGPEDRAAMPNMQKIWHTYDKLVSGKTAIELWVPTAPRYITDQSVYVRARVWTKDVLGRPTGTWVVAQEGTFTISYLRSHHLFEYMIDEHEVNLETDLGVKMPSVTEDDEGNVTFWGTVDENGEKIPSIKATKEGLEFLTRAEGLGYTLEYDKNGNYGYYVNTGDGKKALVTMDDSGNFIYLDENGQKRNIRDLTFVTDVGENFRGTQIREGFYDENGHAYVYKFGTEIENWAGGEMVVANVDGDVVRIGSERTQWSTTVAEKINGTFLGATEYIVDPLTGKKSAIKIGHTGQVSYRARYDRRIGAYVEDPDGPVLLTGDGFWDTDNLALQGGVQTIEGPDGTRYTYLNADRTIVGNVETQVTVFGALLSSGVITQDEYGNPAPQALVAHTIYAQDINALNVRCNNIETNYLKTKSLASAFSLLEDVVFNNGGNVFLGGTWREMPSLTSFTVSGAKMIFTSTRGDHDSVSCTAGDFYRDLQVVKINSYQYKIQYKKLADREWADLPNSTFSGASLLSGSWSGGIFTVKFDPDGTPVPPNSIRTTALKLENKADNNPQRTGKSIKQVIKVRWFDSSLVPYTTNPYQDTGFEQDVTIDATLVYGYAWGEAFKKVDCPSTASTGTSLTIRYPGASSDSQSSRVYTFGNIDNNTVKLETVHHWNGSTPVYNTVAQYKHNQYYRATPASATIGDRISGTTSYRLNVKKNDGTTTTFNVNCSTPYSHGQELGESIGKAAGRKEVRDGIHGLGTVSLDTTYYASSYGWEGFSSFTVPAGSSYPYTITFGDYSMTRETLPDGHTVVYHHHYIRTTNSDSRPAGGQMTFHYD